MAWKWAGLMASVASAMVLTTGCSTALPPAPEAAAAPAGPVAYTLGSGDKVRIIVFGEEGLTGEYSIADNGDLSFPLIGTVPAKGHSVAQLQAAVRERLANGYLKDPRVSVEVLTYRPYYILGEVNKPGEYPYTAGLTLQQAVATAGGYTYRANTRRIAVKHADETAEHGVEVRGGPSVSVQPGDTIRIPERFF